MKIINDKRYFSRTDVAKYLEVGRETIRYWERAGYIKPIIITKTGLKYHKVMYTKGQIAFLFKKFKTK